MELLWKLINPATNLPITGGAASTALKIRRGADGYLLDWNDLTFKASGWGTLSTTMTEVSAANLPGLYNKSVDASLWNDGWYQIDAAYSTTIYAMSEVYVYDGLAGDETIITEIGSVTATVDFTPVLSAISGVDGKIDIVDANVDTLNANVTIIDGNVDDIEILATTIDGKVDDVLVDTAQIIVDIYNLTHVNNVPVSIVIPAPSISNVCRVFELAYNQAGSTPQDSELMSAKIVRLPFDYDGKLHAGTVVTASKTTPDIDGNYAIYWDLPYTSKVTVYLSEHGVHKEITVPETTSARLADLL